MNHNIAQIVYRFGSSIIGEKTYQYLVQLKENQRLPSEKIIEIQWNKFVRLLDHHYRCNDYFREKLDSHGVKVEDIRSQADLHKIPVLTKDELRARSQEMRCRHCKVKYSIAKSSGSTGKSVKFYKDRNSSAQGRAAMYRGHSWYDVDVGEMEARLWGVPLNRKDWFNCKIGDFLLNRFREIDFNLSDQVMEQFLKRMRRRKPAYLMGYSSLIYEFARYLDANNINAESFALKMVKVTAENLFDWQKDLLKNTFNAPIVVEYGAAEVGIVAFQCPNGNMHLNAEGVLVEEKNCDYDSELKELVITDLNNYCTPIIRYELGDFGILGSGTCDCGVSLPILDRVIGRTSDVVYRSDGSRVHSSIFSYILKELTASGSGIMQYRIIQKELGKLTIQLVRGRDFRESGQTLLLRLIEKKLGPNIVATIEYVPEIPREESGKLRYFVSEISR